MSDFQTVIHLGGVFRGHREERLERARLVAVIVVVGRACVGAGRTPSRSRQREWQLCSEAGRGMGGQQDCG